MSEITPLTNSGFQIASDCFRLRQDHFPDEITFYGPGLKVYRTSEFSGSMTKFVSISVTGNRCALNCEHCQTNLLHDMLDLTTFNGSLYDMCEDLKQKGTKGILISGGSNERNQVPLMKHVPDMIRIRRELDMVIRVHPGLPDEETVAALSEVGLDGVMLDIIGDQETITDIYHLDATPADYEAVLERLERYGVPAIPHIILGHYYGEMRGEYDALEMIRRHSLKSLVIVVLMPLTGTPMDNITPPSIEEIGTFFQVSRRALPDKTILLGCARPLGSVKKQIDELAVDAGFNGIAYPADGIVQYARSRGLSSKVIHACCGVTW